MSTFKEISPFEIAQNPFSLIGKDWALVTAKNGDGCNTMTASWGGVGIMWNKPVTFAFIRPQRFTFGLLENEEYFSMSFYPEEYRKALTFCGTKSGRDVDKVKECGFTPNYSEKAPYFEEAKLVLICRKLYAQELMLTAFSSLPQPEKPSNSAAARAAQISLFIILKAPLRFR